MSQQKPQLVLLHGLFGSPLGLADITANLRNAGYEVFVPAVPPFAGSEADWDQLHQKSKDTKHQLHQNHAKHQKTTRRSTKNSIPLDQLYADYFRDYFAKHQIKRPVLIGHSMGTLVVTSIIRHYPDLVHPKIILMSPISNRSNFALAQISLLSAYLPPKLIDWITTKFLIVPHNNQIFRETLDQVHRCTFDQRPCRQYIAEATKFSTSYTISENLLAANPTDQHFRLLLLPGESDHLVPQAATRQAADTLNQHPNFDCKCVFLPGTGHLHNYEKPHETAAAILDFLRES